MRARRSPSVSVLKTSPSPLTARVWPSPSRSSRSSAPTHTSMARPPRPLVTSSRSSLVSTARLSVEQVHVASLRCEVDDGALFWRGAAVDTSDDRLDVTSGLGGRAIDVCVGAELLDDLDGDGQTLAVSG